MRYIDLHVHTNCSDGSMTPSEVVQQALDLGLAAIAITDHDTVAGVKEAKDYVIEHNCSDQLEIIPGIEISAEYKGKDIHILGLYLDETNEALNDKLTNVLKERDMRNETMAQRLREDGIDIHVKDLTYGEPDGVITRAHFARFLKEHHYVKDNAEAFTRYLGYDTKYYVPRTYMSPADAISIIKEAGGIPVLAHPLLYGLKLDELDTLVAYVKDLGIVGIEAIYSANTGLDEGIVRRYVNKYDLLMTGGSDFHGINKPLISLGTGRGNLKIPETLLDNLKEWKKS